MESALMMLPPRLCASASASADFPLAVGPAISTTPMFAFAAPFITARHCRAYMRRPLSRTFLDPVQKVLEPGGCGNSAALMTRADSRDRAGPLVKPQSRLRCAKGAGLDERPCPVDHAVVSFKPYGASCLLAQEWNPTRSPIAHVRFLIAQTYIRSGLSRTKLPHAWLRGRRAPRGWDQS